MAQRRVAARRSKAREAGDESLAAVPQRAAARAPAREVAIPSEVKLEAGTEVWKEDIIDTDAGASYKQTTYTDSATAKTYTEEGRPEPSRKGFTIKHTFNGGLPEEVRVGGSLERTDRHGVEIFFDGSSWALANLSYGNNVSLGKSSVGGFISEGEKLALPSGFSVEVKEFSRGSSGTTMIVNLLDQDGQSLKGSGFGIGLTRFEPGDGREYWMNFMNMKDGKAEVEVYTELVELKEARSMIAGELSAGEEMAFPNGYRLHFDGVADDGASAQLTVLNPKGNQVKSGPVLEGEVAELVLPDGKTYWARVLEINESQSTANITVYGSDPREAEPLEDGTRVKLEWSPQPVPNKVLPSEENKLNSIELWHPRTLGAGRVVPMKRR